MDEGRTQMYQAAYLADYDFESMMVHYRRRLLLERLEMHRPGTVVEIGCGAELLYGAWHAQDGLADRWIIVEPVKAFCDQARSSNLPNLCVIEGLFEDSLEAIDRLLPVKPDMIICSSLLHEVPSSEKLLLSIAKIMGKDTLLHVNVPNSESMHRRLAKTMGLIPDTHAMSDRNKRLMQGRVYDMGGLKAELSACGLRAIGEGGYFIKPFTHKQMEQIMPAIDRRVLDGLFALGKENPAMASEIYVEARKVMR